MEVIQITSRPDQPSMCFVPCMHERTVVNISVELWESALRLADYYGWEAEGTAPPSYLYEEIDPETGEDMLEEVYRSWSGTYLTRQQQPVTQTDASCACQGAAKGERRRAEGGGAAAPLDRRGRAGRNCSTGSCRTRRNCTR